MSRSGYTDDCENLELWRGAVERSIRGKRGQAFLREMLESLDGLSQKRLISGYLEEAGEVCAIGSVGKVRNLEMGKIDYNEPRQVAKAFGIAYAMAAEIEFINDEAAYTAETPEQRFQRVRKWVVENIAVAETEGAGREGT